MLTTNLVGTDDADALRRQIGARTVSRIYEMCGEPLPLFGTDHRMEAEWELPEPGAAAPPPASAPAWDPFDDSTWEDDDRPRYGRPRGTEAQPLD